MKTKEHPILFGEQMALAILEGRKTQTRRVIKTEWSRCLDLEEPVAVMAALFQQCETWVFLGEKSLGVGD
jgi:hypothetical protein